MALDSKKFAESFDQAAEAQQQSKKTARDAIVKAEGDLEEIIKNFVNGKFSKEDFKIEVRLDTETGKPNYLWIGAYAPLEKGETLSKRAMEKREAMTMWKAASKGLIVETFSIDMNAGGLYYSTDNLRGFGIVNCNTTTEGVIKALGSFYGKYKSPTPPTNSQSAVPKNGNFS